MSDYKVFNDIGEERTWEELYEDNVLLSQENQQLKHNWNELKKWLEQYFKGMTIEEIGIDDFYKKGMYRMNEYTLDKTYELEKEGNVK